PSEAYFRDFDWPRHGAAWRGRESPAHQMGIDLAAAQSELERLYPPDVCRQLVTTEHRHLFNDLFLPPGAWLRRVERLLRLGADLATIPGWHTHPQLVARLRHLGLFAAARLEVGIWAGLNRVHARAQYLPATGAGKSGDFLLEEDAIRVA